MLVANTITFFSKNLHEIGVQFPQERNAFVLDHQHGRHDVRCNPIMDPFTFFPTFDMDQLGKIRPHHWKEHLKISKIAKHDSGMS